MKHHFSKIFILLTLLLFGITAYAEEIIVGNGTVNSSTTNGIPFYYYYGAAWTENLFTQDELEAAGMSDGEITSLALYMMTKGTRTYTWGNFSIWVANTNLTEFSATKTTKENVDYQLVYDYTATTQGSANYQTADGYIIDPAVNENNWLTYQFTQPFSYTGGGLLVYICYYTKYYGGTTWGFRATGGFGAKERCYFRYADNYDNGCGTATWSSVPSPTFRLDMKFDIQMGASFVKAYPEPATYISNLALTPSQHPGISFKRTSTSAPKPNVTYDIYHIEGYGSSLTVPVYSASASGIDLMGPDPVRYNFTSASGSRAGTSGNFNMAGIPAGKYKIIVAFDNQKKPVETYESTFDIEIVDPVLDGIFPTVDAVLEANATMPLLQHPAVVVSRPYHFTPVPEVTYKIINPSGATVYTAQTNSGSTTVPVDVEGMSLRYNFTRAVGSMAFTDGSMNLNNAEAGTYTIIVTFDDKRNPVKETMSTFIVIKSYDLVLANVSSPSLWNADTPPAERRTYSIGSQIPVEFTITNAGANAVYSFELTPKVYNKANVRVDALDPYVFNNAALPILSTTTRTFATIEDINTTGWPAGDYSIVCDLAPINPVLDEDLTNNVYPRTGKTMYFTLVQPFNVTITSMALPTPDWYRYPVVPKFTIRNNGNDDVTGSIATLTISKGTTVVHTDEEMVENIQGNSIGTINFNKEFIPLEEGAYSVRIKLALPTGDIIQSYSFTVKEGLSGTYTIGAGTAPRNYSTFKAASDDLYRKGVSGNVVFELTGREYTFTGHSGENMIPDFRSKIVGVGPNATITFKPNQLNDLQQVPINITIRTDDGYGIRFGQALETGDYTMPAVNHISDIDYRRDFANSAGYIIFDGGIRKNISFTMLNSNTNGFAVPFYLGEGSQNITIKNCQINGTRLYTHEIPNIAYVDETIGVLYEDNVHKSTKDNTTDLTYSAGVTIRNKPYSDVVVGAITYEVDNIPANNIKVDSNIIQGFGYGIVSLGTGVLPNKVSGSVTSFYNNSNEFTNNYIHTVAKSGMFLGFEKNALVKNNRIEFVNGASKVLTSGIELGGNFRYDTYFGYHNVNVTLDGNEINNVYSDSASSYGIHIEQYPIRLRYNNADYKFPAKGVDSFYVFNNIIYGLKTAKDSVKSNKAAISINTTRMGLDINDLYYPLYNDYDIADILFANNSIYIEKDTVGKYVDNDSAFVTGMLVQNVDKYHVLNNVIAIKEANIPQLFISALALQDINPKKLADVEINKNCYYVTGTTGVNPLNSSAGLIRFVEMDEMGRFLDNGGYANEYSDIDQWRGWTRQDESSINFDFTIDMKTYAKLFNGQKLYDMYRMNILPNQVSNNSPVNNRGEKLAAVNTDIDGKSRINLDASPDLGACEFDCNVYQTDIEVKTITTPAAYRSAKTDTSNEAINKGVEQVMTAPVVDIKAIVRNNGSVFVSNFPIKCTVVGTGVPAIAKTINISLAPGEEKEVSFELTDGSSAFRPKTYYELNTTPPALYSTMATTVTPTYKIDVATDKVDEDGRNNRKSKTVRFFVPRSDLGVLISAENTNASLYKTGVPIAVDNNVIAGKLNYDTLIKAFNNMAYFVTSSEGKHHMDVLDRNCWEPRSVDYSLYKTLFWSDGDDKALSYWEVQNLLDFANLGIPQYKRNVIIASQEIIRENPIEINGVFNSFNNELQKGVLRSIQKNDGIYDAANVVIKGSYEARNTKINIIPTQYNNVDSGVVDNGPVPCEFSMIDTIQGENRVAYYYYDSTQTNPDKNVDQKVSVISAKLLERNSIYAAFDWRHLANASDFLRGIFDDLRDDLPVPVKLLGFNANAVGRRVVLDWATAFEEKTMNFEIERADIVNNNVGIFNTVSSVKAAGTSNTTINYNQIDENVDYGNKYAYRLKMNEADGVSSYSDIENVTIEYIEGASFGEASPNPTATTATIKYSLNNESNVIIKLLEFSGKEIATLFNGKKDSGPHTLDVDVTDLASGVYSVMFDIDGKLIVKYIVNTK